MIEHRRINHPSNKTCSKCPIWERGDQCLYNHEGYMDDVLSAHVNQGPRNDNKITLKTCKQDFRDKNKMMVQGKIDLKVK